MRRFQVLILAALLGVAAATLATPAAATSKDEALAMCAKRNAGGRNECNSYGLGSSQDTVVICVNNSSTGHGVQCVKCQGSKSCTVIEREGPRTKKRPVTDIDPAGVLTRSRPPSNSAVPPTVAN